MPSAMSPVQRRITVIGSGIAGLAAAARLAAAGCSVIVLERHDTPGGKIRCLPSAAGPVDTGPTVLTMRRVFDELFQMAGARLEDHVALLPQTLLARHFWPDGSKLDLYSDPARNAEAIAAFAGSKARRQFEAFAKRAKTLFDGFDAPMMQAAEPNLADVTRHVAMRPALARQMAPFSTLDALLGRSFDDQRLVQLFGRYATYVGGSPYQAPAILALIWHAESAGVWVVRGGMHKLAEAIADLAASHGATFRYGAHVDEIITEGGAVTSVRLADGTMLDTDAVVFNGDPRALAMGALGPGCAAVAPQTLSTPRSLSATVLAFSAMPAGHDLAHHNVFFRATPKPEFDALEKGRTVPDPTLYICAMDRGLPEPSPALERFEIIANAAPLTVSGADEEEFSACQTRIFRTLARFGLSFDPLPGPEARTTAQGFEDLFPMTAGSLYGQSPHGAMAAFQRPTARTQLRGLYLAGGGVHPGAGVPMAALSGKHAAEAILSDRISTSMSRPTAMRGGMSTESAMTARARSASSGS